MLSTIRAQIRIQTVSPDPPLNVALNADSHKDKYNYNNADCIRCEPMSSDFVRLLLFLLNSGSSLCLTALLLSQKS